MDGQRAIARRMVIGLPPEGISAAWERDFAAYPPAGVILFRRDFKDLAHLREITQRLRELAQPRRLFLSMDEEGGFVSQLGGHLVVPPNAGLLGRGAERGEIEWLARVTGERLRSLGLDWVFAPDADIHSEPRNPVIGPRAYGSDPTAVATRVFEAVSGLRQARVASCIKHFPGHGDTTRDSHHTLPRCEADREMLERRELVPFRANLDADSVMTAHVVFPALDRDRPGTFSRAITHDLLRERLGFRGVTVTDALEMKGAAEGRGAAEIGKLALDAGCDLLLFAFHDEAVRRARLELAKELVDGAIDRDTFDAARPRLEAFANARPAPTADELAVPLESLTPHDWTPRLETIIARGLRVLGGLPQGANGPWRVVEPEFPYGPTFRSELERLGMPLADGDRAQGEIVAIMTRLPVPPDELERLRARARGRPTVLIGMQNDSFLDDLPEAALRISAADATPLTRAVVARTIADALRAT
jgi:beta-glucosidase-like glycosyl hydrolase